MRKSKNISKYYTPWQLTRATVRLFKNPEDKLSHVLAYLEHNLNYPNYERVYNWAEGLLLGYKGKNPQAVLVIQKFLQELSTLDRLPQTEPPEPSLTSYTQQELLTIYKDLYERARGWVKDHYYNEELLSYLEKLETALRISPKKSTKYFRQEQAKDIQQQIKPAHTFLY